MDDPAFHEFGASGRVWDRASVLDLLGGDDTPAPAVDDVRATRLGPDAILLAYRTHEATRTVLRSSVWRRAAGGPWRVFFHQGTPVPGAE